RLLAPGSRLGHGRPDRRKPDAERRHGEEDNRRRGGTDERAANLRVQRRARDSHHHAGGVHPGADETGSPADYREVFEVKNSPRVRTGIAPGATTVDAEDAEGSILTGDRIVPPVLRVLRGGMTVSRTRS